MTPRDGTVELTAHQRLRLLTSATVVLETVVIIYPDWIELRLLDTATHQRWVVDPYLTNAKVPSFRAHPPRIVGPAAGKIAERFLPAVIRAVETEIADRRERATWSYDERQDAALREYHEDFARGLRQLLAKLLAGPNGRHV